MSALLSGIFNNRPPQPKYTFVRDVKRVIEFLKALPYDSDLILKNLTLKLTLTLTSTLRFLTKNNSGHIFHFRKTQRSVRKENSEKQLFLSYLTQIRISVCVCHHIDLYLERKKEWHKTEPQLLLSFIGTHPGVSTLTISRWIISFKFIRY